MTADKFVKKFRLFMCVFGCVAGIFSLRKGKKGENKKKVEKRNILCGWKVQEVKGTY